jgi:hypothetical protein
MTAFNPIIPLPLVTIMLVIIMIAQVVIMRNRRKISNYIVPVLLAGAAVLNTIYLINK